MLEKQDNSPLLFLVLQLLLKRAKELTFVFLLQMTLTKREQPNLHGQNSDFPAATPVAKQKTLWVRGKGSNEHMTILHICHYQLGNTLQ